jgi:hypothetical protein
MSNKVQRYTVYFIWKLLYMFRVVPPPIIKSANCIYSIWYLSNILIYVQQGATLHSLFYLETALLVSGGTSTHHQERKQLYLQHLVFVRPLLLPAAITAGSSNGLKYTRCCRYSCLRSWWWVELPSDTCRTVSRWNKLCNVASCLTYILEYSYDTRTHVR